MIKFTASNGIDVTILDDGQVGFRKRVGGVDYRAEWITPEENQAFREAIEHERSKSDS